MYTESVRHLRAFSTQVLENDDDMMPAAAAEQWAPSPLPQSTPMPPESLLTRPSHLHGFVHKDGPLDVRWWHRDHRAQRHRQFAAFLRKGGDGVTALPREPPVVFPDCQIWVVRSLPLTCCLTCHTNLHLSHRPAPRRRHLASPVMMIICTSESRLQVPLPAPPQVRQQQHPAALPNLRPRCRHSGSQAPRRRGRRQRDK